MPEPLTDKPEKRCLECGEPLGPGREDRKYCNDLCKTAYHNRKRKEPMPDPDTTINNDWRPGFYEKINTIIARNRYIIQYLMEIDFRVIEKHDLEGYGFNFKYFTSEYTDPENGTYRFCYDQGYCLAADGRMVYLLSRTEEILC